MQGYYITQAEMRALGGCSPLAFRVYHFLRYRMDLHTGQTGAVYRVSYASMIEACQTQIPRGAGTQIVLPSQKEMRGALANLERAGLLKKSPEAFVFTLLLAKILPPQTGHSAGKTVAAAKPRPSGRRAPSRQPIRRIQGTYQQTGLKNQKKAAAESAVDKSASPDTPALLDQFAQQIGYPIKHHPASVARLMAHRPSPEQLATAILAAVAARKRDQNPAPLNPGFIACFLHAPPKPHTPRRHWQDSWSGIVAHAQTLGIHQRQDEHPQAFRARVIGAEGL